MILLNQSSHMLLRDLTSLRWLLENLGFIINWKKSVWALTQEIQYLGFLIDSVNMVIRLPSEKIQIILKCQCLVSKKITQVRKISEILGLMTSSLQAIAPAPLHYRHLPMTHIRGLLVNKSYQAKVALNSECLLELRWWISQMQSWNGKSMISAGPDLTLTSDASKRGWGATLGSERAQGLWTQEETSLHINVLELKGVLFALRMFAQDLRKVHVHLKLDNRTAVAYIQKMGGTFRWHAPNYTGDMEVRSRQGNSPVRGVSARLSEFRSRLAVEELPRQQRLAAEEIFVPTAE